MSVRTSRCDSSVDSTVFFISKAFRIEPPAAREWSSGETEGTAMLLNKQLAGLRRCTRVRVWCDFFNCAKYSQLDSNVFRRLPRTVLFFSSFFFFLIFSSKGRSWGKTIFVDRFRHWIFRGFVCSDDVVAPAIGQAPTKSACFRVTAAPKCFWVCRNCTRLALSRPEPEQEKTYRKRIEKADGTERDIQRGADCTTSRRMPGAPSSPAVSPSAFRRAEAFNRLERPLAGIKTSGLLLFFGSTFVSFYYFFRQYPIHK